jgi:hypothetical protein
MIKRKEDALPFNVLELLLFAHNCLFQVFSEDKDNNRVEMLFSVAILILLYFVVMQTFFPSSKSSYQSKKNSFSTGILDEMDNQLFLNQFNEIYEMEFEKKRKLMLLEGGSDSA